MLRLIGVRDGDRGAVAMIVAMLFGFGVMIGLAALTIDVGNINADRRQLQNGADAVALAVAQQCAQDGTCLLDDTTLPNLRTLANANAADNATSIKRVDNQLPLLAPAGSPAICGTAPGLKPCLWTENMSNLQECPPVPTAGVNYVRVYTETDMTKADGTHENILPYYFGAALTGVSGANQQACATVIYGPPSGAAAPIALSYCEWAAATGNNAVAPVPGAGTYAADPTGDWPGYGAGQTAWPAPSAQLTATFTPTPVPRQEIIIGLQGSSGTCPTWNTHDAPGGFGFVSTATSCEATAAPGGWIQADPGNGLPTSCTSLFPYFNTVIYLPVFDCIRKIRGSDPDPTGQPAPTESCITGAGQVTWYHIMGYAKFYLSGYKTAGGGVAHEPAENHVRTQTVTSPCPANALRCLSGWFLEGLVDAPPAPPPPPGTPLLGAYSIRLAG